MKLKGINHNIGDKFRKQRDKLGYSQLYVATKLGITVNSYFRIETCRSDISLSRLFHIAMVLEITGQELLSGVRVKI